MTDNRIVCPACGHRSYGRWITCTKGICVLSCKACDHALGRGGGFGGSMAASRPTAG